MFTSIQQLIIKLVLLFGGLILLSAAVQAQPKRIPVEKQIQILRDKLKLNDEQSKKIKTILEDQHEETTAAMSENRSDHQAMLAAVEEITKRTDKRIKKNLTEPQVKMYDKMIKDRQTEMGNR
jgi:hypothetical protein